MKTAPDNSKTGNKTVTPMVIRMGREVPAMKAPCCDSEKDAKCVEKEKKAKEERDSENKASSLV
jgi:hypothetical protein